MLLFHAYIITVWDVFTLAQKIALLFFAAYFTSAASEAAMRSACRKLNRTDHWNQSLRDKYEELLGNILSMYMTIDEIRKVKLANHETILLIFETKSLPEREREREIQCTKKYEQNINRRGNRNDKCIRTKSEHAHRCQKKYQNSSKIKKQSLHTQIDLCVETVAETRVVVQIARGDDTDKGFWQMYVYGKALGEFESVTILVTDKFLIDLFVEVNDVMSNWIWNNAEVCG